MELGKIRHPLQLIDVKIYRGAEMKVTILRLCAALALIFLLSCTSTRTTGDKSVEGPTAPPSEVTASAIQGTAFGPAREFVGSPYQEVGLSGLFDVHSAESCRIAVLPNGDDSFSLKTIFSPF